MFSQDYSLLLDDESCSSAKNVEKLAGVVVIMHLLGLSGRDPLLNNTEIVPFEQVPTVAAVAPKIMFSIVKIGRFDHSSSLRHRIIKLRA